MSGGRPHVLHLARNFPNRVTPTLGLWTRRLVAVSRGAADPTVIAPVPYVPPLVPVESYARFRRVERREKDGEVDVHHPRVPTGPGRLLHRFEASLGLLPILWVADHIHRRRPVDLIHAHFIYPEGVIAARLGKRYGVPVVSTEHAAWLPWLANDRAVRAQVFRALPAVDLLLPVSRWLERNIREAAGDRARTEVVYNVLDEDAFSEPSPGERWDAEQILFVGLVRHVKGLDILVRALARLAGARPSLRLLVLGAAYYRSYQRDYEDVRRLVEELGLGPHVRFGGEASPTEVAAAMRRSALLVVPSRRESFSAVTVEALASGTPVVATRCGGPEEILTPETGRLVPPEDPEALAAAIDSVLADRPSFDPAAMRAQVLARFGPKAIAARLAEVYEQVLRSPVARLDTAGTRR